MTKMIIGHYELRNVAKKTAFAALFPEHQGLFQAYWNKPGCSDCWRALLKVIAQEPDRIKAYFGDVDIDLGEMPLPKEHQVVQATTVVMNCSLIDLQSRIDQLESQNAGAKIFALARWKDQITLIVNVVDTPVSGVRYLVFHTDVKDLSERLDAIEKDHPGPKQFTICRYEDLITCIATIFQ